MRVALQPSISVDVHKATKFSDRLTKQIGWRIVQVSIFFFQPDAPGWKGNDWQSPPVWIQSCFLMSFCYEAFSLLRFSVFPLPPSSSPVLPLSVILAGRFHARS